jgi:hypothetical protein
MDRANVGALQEPFNNSNSRNVCWGVGQGHWLADSHRWHEPVNQGPICDADTLLPQAVPPIRKVKLRPPPNVHSFVTTLVETLPGPHLHAVVGNVVHIPAARG